MELVKTGSVVTMTSLELVEFINSQRGDGEAVLAHSDFMKKVPLVLGKVAGNFSCYYKAANGKQNPCYRFPKREACLMAMSYSYELQAKVFDRMTELEEKSAPRFSIPQSFREALLLAAEQQRVIDEMQVKAEKDRPKVEFAEAVRNTTATLGIGEFAKIIGTGEKRLFARLRRDGFLMEGNIPYQRYLDMGLFKVVENIITINGNDVVKTRTFITGKGQVVLERKYRENGTEVLQ